MERVGQISVSNRTFPKLAGESDDGLRLRRALAWAKSMGHNRIVFGPGGFDFKSKTTIADHEVMFEGSGVKTKLMNGNNTVILDVVGAGFQMRNLQLAAVETVARSNFLVTVTGGVRPLFENLYVQGNGATRYAGIHFASGSMGTVRNSIFNHACIKISAWDVKVDKCYIWAMSCDYAVGLFNGAGNATLTNVDVVPPLHTNPNGRAAIFIDGASGSPYNTKMSNIYLDGNPSLDTGVGIYVGAGAGATLMENITANRMDRDAIVIDSAINVVLNGYSGHSNNNQGRGAREIFITRTGTQAVEKIRLSNIQCLKTAAVAGQAGPAIEVHPSVTGSQVVIDGFDIKQPSGGGGYSLPEVKVDHTKTSMVGRGQLRSYSGHGSVRIAAGAPGVTINLASPAMAYRPLISDISLSSDIGLPGWPKIQFISDNQVYVSWAGTAAVAGNLYWRVDLRR